MNPKLAQHLAPVVAAVVSGVASTVPLGWLRSLGLWRADEAPGAIPAMVWFVVAAVTVGALVGHAVQRVVVPGESAGERMVAIGAALAAAPVVVVARGWTAARADLGPARTLVAGLAAVAVAVSVAVAASRWRPVARGMLVWAVWGWLSLAMIAGSAVSDPYASAARVNVAGAQSVAVIVGADAAGLWIMLGWLVLVAVLAVTSGLHGDDLHAAAIGAMSGPVISGVALLCGVMAQPYESATCASGECGSFTGLVLFILELLALAVLAAVAYGAAAVGRRICVRTAP